MPERGVLSPLWHDGHADQQCASLYSENFHLPGVISEWGVPALSSNRRTDGQASKINTFIGDVKKLNIPLTSIYEWKNSDSGSNDREKNFGLLTSDGQPKPADVGRSPVERPIVRAQPTCTQVGCFEPVGCFGIVFIDTPPRLSNNRFQVVAAGAIDTRTRP